MLHSCRQCASTFAIRATDLAYYERIAPVFSGRSYPIPPPKLCPACREQNRFAFRNEWSLHRRRCDSSGRSIVSIYSADKPYKVYEQSLWWSDAFDPLEYGREFDFSRPFFDQWFELSLAVPRLSIHNAKSDNSEFTNYSSENKNCYMVVGSTGNEDTLYSFRASSCRDVVDSYDPYKCELCYEVSLCKDLSSSCYCSQCHNSRNLVCCADCIGCRDCFGCVNLRHKEYHIFNKPYAAEEYRKRLDALLSDPPSARRQFESFRNSQPVRGAHILNSDACTGDNLIDCKNCTDAFLFKNSEDCAYGSFGIGMTSSVDVNYCNESELVFNSSNLIKDYNVLFANLVWYSNTSLYVTSCFNSANLFGCVGMKKNEYCILNKQYTKQDYLVLVPQIIAHMQATREWGEYFPVQYSPFGYNETAAADYYPLSKSDVLERGWTWCEETSTSKLDGAVRVDQSQKIGEVTDEVLGKTLLCSVTDRPYRITPHELNFYRKLGVSLPGQCPEQRRRARLAGLPQHQLWKRPCARCGAEMMTSFAPDDARSILCETCFLEAT